MKNFFLIFGVLNLMQGILSWLNWIINDDVGNTFMYDIIMVMCFGIYGIIDAIEKKI